MSKRIFDFLAALAGLILASPILVPVITLVWLYDFHSPFYVAPRVGKNGRLFKMLKLRSMVVNADKTGVDSTAADDFRITPMGKIIRRFKLDELSQLWNVFVGDMSLVGPRPQVKRDVDLYTDEEKTLLFVRPGITDFSSIVFADEGDILKGLTDPDLGYHQLIRPWKSRLGLFYIAHRSFFIDLRLVWLTVVAIFSRPMALSFVRRLLEKLGAQGEILTIAERKQDLSPYPPPGALEVVSSR